MGKFAQFGLYLFKQVETHFSELHIHIDPNEQDIISSITAMLTFAKVTCMGRDH